MKKIFSHYKLTIINLIGAIIGTLGILFLITSSMTSTSNDGWGTAIAIGILLIGLGIIFLDFVLQLIGFFFLKIFFTKKDKKEEGGSSTKVVLEKRDQAKKCFYASLNILAGLVFIFVAINIIIHGYTERYVVLPDTHSEDFYFTIVYGVDGAEPLVRKSLYKNLRYTLPISKEDRVVFTSTEKGRNEFVSVVFIDDEKKNISGKVRNSDAILKYAAQDNYVCADESWEYITWYLDRFRQWEMRDSMPLINARPDIETELSNMCDNPQAQS